MLDRGVGVHEIPDNRNFGIKLLSGNQLLDNETERVSYYLENYESYKQKGLDQLLRFPQGITPGKSYNKSDIQKFISDEHTSLKDFYEEFSQRLTNATHEIYPHLRKLENLYGFGLNGIFHLAPSAYGTIGGTIGLFNSIAFRLPNLYQDDKASWRPDIWWTTGKYRSALELITHEVLAHKLTEELRSGTVIDEEVPHSSHQWHKEYLMDLIGRTFLTESELMVSDQVTMQVKAIEIAQREIDPLFFQKSGDISWRGDVRSLINRIDKTLRE